MYKIPVSFLSLTDSFRSLLQCRNIFAECAGKHVILLELGVDKAPKCAIISVSNGGEFLILSKKMVGQ